MSAKESNEAIESQPVTKPAGAGYIRLIILLLASLFLISVLIEVFLAGMASLVNATHWKDHTTFVHFFEMLPVGIFVLSFVAKIGGAVRWLSLTLVGFIGLQYITVNLVDTIPMLAAMHPVFAIVLFWLSIVMVKKSFVVWRHGLHHHRT
ncbi:hypothetical protein Back11_40530 [Paenibacillus baekrokdamisoli]|uniref:Uncharacterized protein n=1 Tax=Paenibacillus baekrokdamisoli TaxID=1712516 RepID=A0A3G9JFA2_9BACL|nr:DUF6220 domain-containing protein [Paenibacillus baekrokdamisoli]MBB3068249.1 hypothetical protein [Paenibacillus baekrokdamisoli]BBH22708.1 hypothetical protein Back11_40530 [Paenibacillus baekrokdamisoli]